MTATLSGVIAVIPEAEAVVAPFRSRLDRSAGWGVAAHVTVLFPFLPPDRLGASVVAALGDAVRTVPRFGLTFPRLGWFGEEALWLAPEPADPFRALTSAVWARYPNHRRTPERTWIPSHI